MPLQAKLVLTFCGVVLLCLCRGNAQVVINCTSLPSAVGEYNLSYSSTNIDASALIGHSGSNFWDFSQPQSPVESILRTDLVPITDGGNEASFPDAAYAQRYTGGIYANPTWEYYRVTPGVGRLYYGFYASMDPTVDPTVVFPQAAVELPASIYYGQTWSREVDYQIQTYLGIPEDIVFTESAAVDAYGTLVLAGIGSVPALRISAIDTYSDTFGSFFDTETDTNYEWVVPGIGIAATMVEYGNDSLLLSQPYSNYFARVFLNPPVFPPPQAQLTLQSNTAVLAWRSTVNVGGYFVQSSGDLTGTNWLPVAQLTNQSFVVPISTGVAQQFFRVTSQP
jgi:hypothetical protein